MTVFLAFSAHVLLSAAGTEIATVIWGTDRFDTFALTEIGDLTAYYALGLWAWSIQGLIARGFYAQQDTWTPTILGTLICLIPIYHSSASTTRQLAPCSSLVSLYVLALTAWLYRKARQQGSVAAPWRPMLAYLVTLWLISSSKKLAKHLHRRSSLRLADSLHLRVNHILCGRR